MFRKCSEYNNTWSNGSVYNTWWEFTTSAVPLGCIYGHDSIHTIVREEWSQNPNYAPIWIHCVNVLLNKEIKRIIHNKQIMLYFFHKSCPIESRVRSFNNSRKYSYNLINSAIMHEWLNTRPIAWHANHISFYDIPANYSTRQILKQVFKPLLHHM